MQYQLGQSVPRKSICGTVWRLSVEAKNPQECERGAGEMQGIVQTYCIHSFALFAFFH